MPQGLIDKFTGQKDGANPDGQSANQSRRTAAGSHPERAKPQNAICHSETARACSAGTAQACGDRPNDGGEPYG